MRKLKTRRLRGLPFRPLLILAGALMLLAALAPRANADLIAYYNFEGTPTPPYPVNLDSHPPAVFFSSGNTLLLRTGPDASMTGVPLPNTDTLAAPGVPLNIAPGDPAANLTSLGLTHSASADLFIDIPLFSSQGFFQDLTVSFAVNVAGNGYSQVALWYSTNFGVSFTMAPGQVFILPNGGAVVVNFTVPMAANNAPGLMLRLAFTGGQSNGGNLQDQIDNIQIGGTIVPEPATVAGGLLGVLGLCWFQRKRLIQSVRLRRA
jgi:hypothetical protein